MTLPALGSLPLERYVLMNWKKDSDRGVDDRRTHLARSFVELGNAIRAVCLYALYDWGDDWHKIFEVMPERLFGLSTIRNPGFGEVAAEHDERLRHYREDFMKDHGSGDGMHLSNLRVALQEYHFWSIVGYLFVADRTALETGKVLIVLFDQCARAVCYGRIQADLAEDTAGAWADGHIVEQPEFYEAELGKAYLPGGACGPPFKID